MRIDRNLKWNIFSIPSTQGWVYKLINVLNLKKASANNNPGLYFIDSSNFEQNIDRHLVKIKEFTGKLLPYSGWHEYDYKILRVWVNNDIKDIIYMINDSVSTEEEWVMMWLSLIPIYEKTLLIGGLPLHSALVEFNSNGILLIGPGGSGKTTSCRRLPALWQPLCDDEVLILPESTGKYRAHPFPTWSELLWYKTGRTWNVEQSLPIKAIFLIHKSDTDEVRRIGRGMAATALTNSALQVCNKGWRKIKPEAIIKHKKLLFNSACNLANSVKTYKLNLSLEGRFWDLIREVLHDDI